MQKGLTHPARREGSAIPPRPRLLNRRSLWALFTLGAILWALAQTGIFEGEVLNPGGWTVARRFLEAALHPSLDPSTLRLVLDAVLTTLAYAVAGTFFSLIFGFFGGILASETWWQATFPRRGYQAPWLGVRAVLAVLRAIHEVIWGLFFINIIGLDPLSAVLAITIPFGAIIAKVFSEILDEAPHEPMAALQSSGVSSGVAFAYALIPLATPDLISYSFYRFECAIRAAAVLGIIGAGGLGYEIMLSLQTLNYEQIWTLLFALFILNGLADLWSALIRRRIGPGRNCCKGGLDVEVIHGGAQTPGRRSSFTNDSVVLGSLIAGALLVPLSFAYIQPDFGALISSNGLEHLAYIVRNSFPPDFSAIPLDQWVQLAEITLAMSLLAAAGAAFFSLPISFPAANNFLLPGGLLDTGHSGKLRRVLSVTIFIAARAVLLFLRSVPPPIWALLLLFIFFPGILPGAIALGLYTLGVLGRLVAEAVENLDERPLHALKAQGSPGGSVFTYGMLPPTMPSFLGYSLYRWEEAMRATVVVGMVGAGGLGRQLTEQLSSFNYPALTTTLIVFVGLTFLVDLISMRARKAFRET